jgi:glycosyltransferase involved in cell wall biosynthesis
VTGALARAANLLAGDGPGAVGDAVRRRAGDSVRRTAGTPRLEHLPDAVTALESRADTMAFALVEQSERTARLEALAEDLMVTLRALRAAPAARDPDAPAATVRVVTIVAPALRAQAQLLAGSLARHQPDWPLQVLELDAAAALAGVELEPLLVDHPPPELLTLLVPRVLLAVGEAHPGPVLHLPATSWVLDDLTPYADALTGAPLLVCARVGAEPPHDGLEPSAARLDAVGHIDPHLIGFDGSPAGAELVRWWIARLELVLGAPGLPGHDRAQRPTVLRSLELAAARPGVAALADPATRLTAYNALEDLLGDDSERLLAGDRPVRMVDLAGLDPKRPFRLDPWSTRVRLSRLPALAQVVADYAARLSEAGWDDGDHAHDVGRSLADGTPFSAELQSLYAIARATGAAPEDPFTPEGTEALRAWLRGPAARGGAQGVTRYLDFMVSRHRRDIALAFAGRPEALVRWAHGQGGAELGIPADLMPGETVDRAADHEAPADAANPPANPEGPMPVRVSGYLGRVIGLGAAARAYAEALRATGLTVSTHGVALDRRDLGAGYGRLAETDQDPPVSPAHGAELICVNPTELPAFLATAGVDLGRPRIGVWGWETDTVPADWAPAYGLVDEVWVYSRFVAENLGRVTDLPVIALPPPVAVPASPAAPERLGVPEGFLFLFVFDYSSTIERKNPVGLIEAFTRAFAPGEGPQLLLKTINAPLLPLAEEEVMWAARDRTDVHVIDRSLTEAERDGLVAACNCYVSLHRSEGFGLTLAEAMAAAKPVIATGWSGNVDFMDADNSLLVDYTLTRVGPGAAIYPADGTWAEPDLGHAARLMRQVVADQAAAARLGVRARDDVARTLSPEVTGTAMRRRLEQISTV